MEIEKLLGSGVEYDAYQRVLRLLPDNELGQFIIMDSGVLAKSGADDDELETMFKFVASAINEKLEGVHVMHLVPFVGKARCDMETNKFFFTDPDNHPGVRLSEGVLKLRGYGACEAACNPDRPANTVALRGVLADWIVDAINRKIRHREHTRATPANA